MKLTLLLLLLLPALASCGTIYSRYAEKTYPPEGRFVSLSRGEVHLVEAGEGQEIVFIHGNFGTTRDLSLSPLYPLLLSKYRVISYDRPGSGYSKRGYAEVMDLDAHADVLEELIQELKLERPILLAHSFGGGVVLAHALKYPESARALVLLGGATYPWPGSRKNTSDILATMPFFGDVLMETLFVPIASLASRSGYQSAFGPDPLPEEFYQAASSLALRPRQFRAIAQDTLPLWDNLDSLRARYPEIRTPMTLVHGLEDTNVGAYIHSERLHEAVPHSSLVYLEKTAHHPHHTKPQEVFQALEALVSSLPKQ